MWWSELIFLLVGVVLGVAGQSFAARPSLRLCGGEGAYARAGDLVEVEVTNTPGRVGIRIPTIEWRGRILMYERFYGVAAERHYVTLYSKMHIPGVSKSFSKTGLLFGDQHPSQQPGKDALRRLEAGEIARLVLYRGVPRGAMIIDSEGNPRQGIPVDYIDHIDAPAEFDVTIHDADTQRVLLRIRCTLDVSPGMDLVRSVRRWSRSAR
ncbi:hypothetical protein [Nocardioides aequoreus]|uniref:hypothetical protein n=1 Tax=Nocardioides aequoreus TaxID=397278 RepID=UPI0012F6C0D8|nr:hypothetical protein [Nocardioides aequoreus]